MIRLEFRENGPLVMETGGQYRLQLGEVVQTIEKPRVSLCRCGASANKPFCDGAHKSNGFTAPASVIELDPSRLP